MSNRNIGTKWGWLRNGLQLAFVFVLIAGLALVQTPFTAQAATIPTFDIVKVVVDDSVTIRTHNFPANMTFTVRMGKIGTRAIGGIEITKTDSGKGGSFDVTYKIPADLKGLAQIAIRMDGSLGYYAYNWFYNKTSTSTTATPVPSGPIPTFSISAVVKDDSVTIKTSNFPANRTFTVLMGKIGTRAVGGVEVGKTDSGKGGSFEATYKIPASLKGLSQIAIRMDSSPYFAYNWFYNSSTGTGGTGGVTPTPIPGYTGYPTFSIIGVDRDNTVTIRAKNLPPHVTFTVRMGKYGTLGLGGTQVATTDSGAGGSMDVTYTIPSGLKGLDRIAIRMDSAPGYFAYNWFWNNDAP
ncbi:hypothetical protein LARV_01777 [Longilinea arvoryzae]|uniref:Uncharacterized protein n=1 Tax=Longilinea arvoryzae TaxID=360412 RepID=A0A0S7BJG8_9CHLR|nr:hypothetical protein [Longilinea arvoryzae]GAP14017.1 hypothetical protein LARV_01777 [Longilinea arvoryzae]